MFNPYWAEINEQEDLILGGHKGRGCYVGGSGGNIQASQIAYPFFGMGSYPEAAYLSAPNPRESGYHFPTGKANGYRCSQNLR